VAATGSDRTANGSHESKGDETDEPLHQPARRIGTEVDMAADFEDLYDLENLDDGEIRDLILQELLEHPEVDPDLVDLLVDDGFVVLEGRVGTEAELQIIEHVITDVLGIGNYSNELVVDALTRAQQAEAADDAVVEDAEIEAQIGEQTGATDPQADHLLEDLQGDLYGTHDVQQAVTRGQAYEPPDRPLQEGIWSEENH